MQIACQLAGRSGPGAWAVHGWENQVLMRRPARDSAPSKAVLSCASVHRRRFRRPLSLIDPMREVTDLGFQPIQGIGQGLLLASGAV